MAHTNIPNYNPDEVERKWQAKWDADGLYHSDIHPDEKKFYALTMLPYPSGDLHIGHWYAMTPSDARARFKRMNGYNVLFPIGFDAFGLPAENAAIKHNIHPKKWTYANIDRMRTQLKSMGAMFDWRREIISADEKYYKWTQWFFKITDYAEELLNFEGIDWPERVRTLQTNWIGKSVGALVTFKTEAGDPIEVFTTRPDTLWGVTFMVLAPEHPLVQKLTTPENQVNVEQYIMDAQRQSDIQREAADKEKTGEFTGGYAINPVSGERIPVWIADYVLMTYGTGAIMAVPAHDQRDFEFARKFKLPVKVVVQPAGAPKLEAGEMNEAIPAAGELVNSGPLTGTPGSESFERAVEYVAKLGVGHASTNYRLRDWLISRQRYWGAPIPIVYCKKHGAVAVPEDQLPVKLPEDVEWKPTGQSPLKLHPTWSRTTCPICGEPAERETDTMDTFMCSSWYFLRYLSPDDDKAPFDQKEYDYWMPVDTYTGGIEHATMHLIYTRFFHKALRDMGIVKGDEPMMQLRNQGMVLGEDSEKMSKSRGNVVAPDDLVKAYGADTVRAYLMFFARWDMGGPWSSGGIDGVQRWLRRTWTTLLEPAAAGKASEGDIKTLRRRVHQTLKAVTRDFESFEFNTIISSLMELMNDMSKLKEKVGGSAAWAEATEIYLKMLAPVAPHISEELWERLGKPYSIHTQSWPRVDEEAAREEEITLVVQVNGKVRERITVPAGIDEESAKKAALESEAVYRFLEGKTPKQVIYVRGRLVNIVV